MEAYFRKCFPILINYLKEEKKFSRQNLPHEKNKETYKNKNIKHTGIFSSALLKEIAELQVGRYSEFKERV